MSDEQIEQRIKELETQLQQLTNEANRQLGIIQGRIEELRDELKRRKDTANK